MTAQNGVNTALTRPGRVFPRPFTDGGDLFPSYGVEDINMKIVNIWKFLKFMSMANALPSGKDEWQMPYPSGTEN